MLLTTTGARTGQKRVHPLVGLVDDGTLYVFASKAGAPTHPDWYHNLLAHPEVEVEFGDERFGAVATPVSGPSETGSSRRRWRRSPASPSTRRPPSG